jgi:hypothetical protein
LKQPNCTFPVGESAYGQATLYPILFLFKKTTMKTIFVTFCTLLLLPCYLLAQHDTIGTSPKQPATYESMKKSASTRMIVGGVAMVGGAILFYTQYQKNFSSGFASAFGSTTANPNEGEAGAIAGFILFAGGTALLISGISKSSKAKKWKAAGKISLHTNTPPVQLAPKANITQQGFTLSIPIGR